MNNPELYLASNQVLRSEIKKFLNLFAKKLRHCENDIIADVGCAAGDTTFEILAKNIGKFQSIMGFDIAPEFITVANDKFKSTKMSFEELDIATRELPLRHSNGFDKIFSFTCLQLVPDIWQAYRNIRDMLKENGEMFILSLISHPIADVFVHLAETEKWSKYIDSDFTAFRNLVENKNKIEYFLKKLKSELFNLGFHLEECKNRRCSYTMHNIEVLQNFVRAINPFMNLIPTEKIEEFIRNCVDELLKILMVDYDSTGHISKIVIEWNSLILHAKKVTLIT